jgi:hypothetical protein
MRERLIPIVATGTVDCARCGLKIVPDDKWELDHKDDGRGWLGPSHARCNRYAGWEQMIRNQSGDGNGGGPASSSGPTAGHSAGRTIHPSEPRSGSATESRGVPRPRAVVDTAAARPRTESGLARERGVDLEQTSSTVSLTPTPVS